MPKQFAEIVMDAARCVEKARAEGFLLYSREYIARHSKLAVSATITSHNGYTTHVGLFEQSHAPSDGRALMQFRLRAWVSASNALKCLLTSGETVIDDMTAISIVYHQAVLLAFAHQYGVDKGIQRFDALFGSPATLTPTVQRLFFGNNMFPKKDVLDPIENFPSLTGLSYIFEANDIEKDLHPFACSTTATAEAVGDSRAQRWSVGSMLIFSAPPAYQSEAASCCCIVHSYEEEEALLWVFGRGNKLATRHTLFTRQTIDFASVTVDTAPAEQGSSTSPITLRVAAAEPKLLLNLSFVINLEKLKFFLEAEQQLFIHTIRGFLNQLIESRRRLSHGTQEMMRAENFALLPLSANQPIMFSAERHTTERKDDAEEKRQDAIPKPAAAVAVPPKSSRGCACAIL